MRKDKIAQVSIRDLHKMTRRETRYLIRWIRSRALELEHEVEGPWLVTRKQYAPRFNFSLMR